MSAATVRFNVGGTVSEVAVSTIKSKPDALLAKMIDGRFPSTKDKSGAYFVDRDPQLFRIVLDVHRDNKVRPLPLGPTPEIKCECGLRDRYSVRKFLVQKP